MSYNNNNDDMPPVGPPASEEAERGALSCLLQEPDRLLGEAVQKLPLEAWFLEVHRIIFHRMLVLFEARMPIDLVTLTNALRDAGELERAGGPSLVAELLTFVPVTSHWGHYTRIILEKWHLRRLLQVTREIADETMRFGQQEGGEELGAFVGRCEQRVFELYQELTVKSSRRGLTHVGEILPEVIDQVEAAMRSKGHTTRGIATGFTSLDRITMGIEAGMFVIAARPSKGKTAVLMQMALNMGLGQGDYPEFRQEPLAVGIFSLETNDANLVRRGLLNLAGINMRRLQDGLMSRVEQQGLMAAGGRLLNSKIYIEACYGLTIQELRAKARNAVRKHGLKAIFIDYLQLMQTMSAVRKSGNRQAELAEISIGVKMLSHELNIPIFVLAQLNRDGDVARPKMSQLRDCGQIEQDADYCVLLCDAPEWASADDPEDCPWTYLGLDVVKQKDGGTTSGTDPLVVRFDKEIFRLSSLEDKLFSNNDEQRQPVGPKFDHDREKRPRGRPRKNPPPGEGMEIFEQD